MGIPAGLARQGSDVGHAVAQQILTWRSTDGSAAVVPYTPGADPGDWQPTPPANLPALAPQWPYVTPFAMTSGSQFRPPPPPALDSAAYAAAFNEVKDLGRADSMTRTDEQTQIARFWNDGLGTAFAMGYSNRIAQQVATDQGLSLVSEARLFALLNIAEADAQISCWDAKYTYNHVHVGDFNGDSKADIVGRALENGQWYVGVSNGSNGFSTKRWDTWSTGATWVDVQVGDFNGDGKTDIVGRFQQAGQWWTDISTGTGFNTTLWTTWSSGVTWVDIHTADFV